MIKMGARGPRGGLIRAVWPLAGPTIHMDGVIPYVALIQEIVEIGEPRSGGVNNGEGIVRYAGDGDGVENAVSCDG